MRRLSFLAIALFVALLEPTSGDSSAQALPFSQAWADTGLLTVSDDWSGVPGIEGFRGDGLTASPNTNPQTLLDGNDGMEAVPDVNANQANPNTFATGGVAEFHIADPVVALQGSGQADAPYLRINLNTLGKSNIVVSYNVRDIDGSADNAVQQVALHYRIGNTGTFTNLPAGYIGDATTGPALATLVTPRSVALPPDANDQPLVQLRIMTTDAPGSDEWIGIDDIRVDESGLPTGVGMATPPTVVAGDSTLLTVAVTPGTNPTSTGLMVSADLSAIGGLASQPFSDDGVGGGDVTAGDDIFTFRATVPSGTPPGLKTLPATIVDANFRIGMASIALEVAAPVLHLAIHDIQGDAATSPFNGQQVQTTGVVTGIRPSSFYMQAPDNEIDADPNTSEGLLVFRPPGPGVPLVARGDLVEVTGTVSEFSPAADPGQRPVTEIAGSPTVRILSRGNALPPPAILTAADTPADGGLDLLEELEGMRVQVAALRIVAPTSSFAVNETMATSMSNGVFFGVIDGVARPMREPGIDPFEPEPPGLPLNVPRFDGNPERIRVDSDAQFGALRIEVAAGQVVQDLVGPLDYDFDTYTILPDPKPAPGYVVTGPQAAVPVGAPAPDQFTVASFNLQRLYDSIADPGTDDPVVTAIGLANRLNKFSLHVRNVLRMPDILGISEAEKLAVLQQLANKINNDAVAAGQPDPAYQAYLVEGNDVGGIDVGFLVKSARVAVLDVTQEGADATFVDPTDGTTDLLNDRPPLVLRAAIDGWFPVTLIANHLRSLSDATDPVDGPRVREKRRAQAEFLANLIEQRQTADPGERIIVLGDMNAFEFNDGLVDSIGTISGQPAPFDEVLLASPDLVHPNLGDLVETVAFDQRYSFVFNGNAQELDHILVTRNLGRMFAGLQYGRANADFPESLRNNANRPERISDHDALVAYFNLPFSLSIDAVSQAEGDAGTTEFTFHVRLDRPSPDVVTVDFDTEAGSANQGQRIPDYTRASGRLTFEPGDTSQPVTIAVFGDRTFETDETFVVRLSNPNGFAEIRDGAGFGTILNDDRPPSLSVGDVSVAEGNGGTNTATFTVSLEGGTELATAVDFTTADLTARQGSDYFAESGTLEFPAGETTKRIHVTVSGDPIDEPDETFAVELSNPINAAIADAQGIATIVDDDSVPAIRMRGAQADEPAEGATPMAFRIELSAPSGRAVTVSFTTVNLTAIAGRDYEARSGTVTFAPGDVEKTIEVPILADRQPEMMQFFLVLLWRPANATIADWFALGRIDDAAYPRLGALSPSSARAGERIAITGANFNGVLVVRFNGVPARFRVISGSELRAVVPRGARTGRVSVTTIRGSAASSATFTILR